MIDFRKFEHIQQLTSNNFAEKFQIVNYTKYIQFNIIFKKIFANSEIPHYPLLKNLCPHKLKFQLPFFKKNIPTIALIISYQFTLNYIFS